MNGYMYIYIYIYIYTKVCFSGDKKEKNEMGGACSAYGEGRGVYRVLVGKPEGKRPLGNSSIDGRITLRWIFSKWDVEYGLDRAGSG